MSEALESVIAARKIQQMEAELREFLIWSGQADVWDAIVQERNAIIQRRKAAELAAQREAERIVKRRKEIGLVAFVVFLGALILYHIIKYIIDAWPT
jgi:ferric-dicitrate binding protein FerR (iron transport regulator)